VTIYANQYKYVVEFEKTLTKNVLNGLTITDKIHFPTKKDAKLWIDDVSKLNRDGKFYNFKLMRAA